MTDPERPYPPTCEGCDGPLDPATAQMVNVWNLRLGEYRPIGPFCPACAKVRSAIARESREVASLRQQLRQSEARYWALLKAVADGTAMQTTTRVVVPIDWKPPV